MKISLNWLKDFVSFNLIDKKTLENVVVGYVESLKKHPDADTLNIATINIGGEKNIEIVCGGTNLKEKTHVPVALPGAVIPGNFIIQKSKIRGQESAGMICAKAELNLGQNNPREIWILDSKKKWTPGESFLKALKLPQAYSPEEISDLFTKHTAEVEGLIHQDAYLNHVVTGKLIEFGKIENSTKLHRGIFDIGWKKIQIVFGSVYTINPGEILPIALPGAKLPNGEIRSGEFSGIKSEGMVCGDNEIGIQNSSEGITRFPKNTPLGKPVAEILNMQDVSLEIDNKSLTHRPDLWGHYGMARELAVLLKKPLKKHTPPKIQTGKTKLTIRIADPKICPRFSACIISGLRITDSPQWLKTRLQAIGIHPLNNIVDTTNYVASEIGQPLHAYDRHIIKTDTLEVRFAKNGEILETIDHKKYVLTDKDPLVTDGKKGVGLASIMGGLDSEINTNTTEIILESANFDPIIVRKSSLQHGLRTEASQRAEKSLDPANTEIALIRAIQILKETCPNLKVISPLITEGRWKKPHIVITIDPKVVCSKIGILVAIPEMIRILKALEFSVIKKGSKLTVTVPSHRATKDVSIEEDIIEEIARIYGYDRIPAKLPALPISLPIENIERSHEHLAKTILSKTLSFTEIFNYSFYSKNIFQKCGLEEINHLKVENYISEDQTHMRTSLIPGLLLNIERNQRQRDTLKLFEIGHTYHEIGEFMPLEEKWLTACISYKKTLEPFYEIKGALETFLTEFHTTNYFLKDCPTPLPYAHPQKCCEIRLQGKLLGYVFTLHPAIAQAFEIEHSVGFFELNFTYLSAKGRELTKFKPLPKFPSIYFDISFLVDSKKTVNEIQKVIFNADKEHLIVNLKLFDIYEGKNIPTGKKSLAFKVELQHPERTLNDQEFQATQKSIFTSIEKIGGEIRR